MPVKPSITVDVRASQAVYTTGPVGLIGKATKIQRAAADVTEGHKVDSPLGTFPVDAQNENYGDNVVDQYALWTSLGSSAASIDTHIVETDSSGDINVVGANALNVRVTPNSGTDGIGVTTSGGSKGLEVIADATSTDYGIAVLSADGATGPSARIETRSTVALDIDAGDDPAIRVEMTSNGGAIGPQIKLDANTIEPNDTSAGTIYNKNTGGISNLKTGMGAAGGFVVIAKNSPCYARSTVVSSFGLSGIQGNLPIGSTFTWKTDMVPQEAAGVLVTIWGKIVLRSQQKNTTLFEVRDVTAGSVTICDIEIDTVEHAGASQLQVAYSTTFSDVYALPGAGARTFDFVYTGDTTGVAGTFSGFVEIRELRG